MDRKKKPVENKTFVSFNERPKFAVSKKGFKLANKIIYNFPSMPHFAAGLEFFFHSYKLKPTTHDLAFPKIMVPENQFQNSLTKLTLHSL